EINDFVDRLKSKLKSGKVPEKEWNLLKVHFEDVHPDFFKKLLLKHPSLTQYDLKLCAYIKINLTTKDIARMLNISNRSVQTARYRIKKKMELPTDYNLFKYIQQF
ncbi:helix-turn-helix transcriptional regulator, partial [Bacteroidota bacterium]